MYPSWLPKDEAAWSSLSVACLASVVLLAYFGYDRGEAARRYFAREPNHYVFLALMTACLLILTCAAIFGARFFLGACLRAAVQSSPGK